MNPHSDAVFRPAEAASEKGPVITGFLRRTKAWPELVTVFAVLFSQFVGFQLQKLNRHKKGRSLITRPSLFVAVPSYRSTMRFTWLLELLFSLARLIADPVFAVIVRFVCSVLIAVAVCFSSGILVTVAVCFTRAVLVTILIGLHTRSVARSAFLAETFHGCLFIALFFCAFICAFA